MPKPLIPVETIYDTALDLLDRDGAEALNARNLAAALKCSTRTLYQQVGKRDEMIGKLIEYYFSRLELAFKEGSTWQESACNWARTLRVAFVEHPNLSRLMGIEHRAPIVQYVNQLLRTLLKAGFDEELALRASRVLTNMVIGLSLSEITASETLRHRARRSPEEIRYEKLVLSRKDGSSSLREPPEVFDNAIAWVVQGIEGDHKPDNKTNDS